MIFDTPSLTAAINTSLADAGVPAGHTNAFVLIATSNGGVKGAISTRLNGVWTIDTTFQVGRGEAFAGGVSVKATW